MVDLLEGNLQVEGETITVEQYLNEMLTLRGLWHRLNESLADWFHSKS